MAEQRTQDVVNQSQSVGDLSPSDAPATTSTPDIQVFGDDTGKSSTVVEADDAPKENGTHAMSNNKMEDLEDGSARSDTDTSRAEGSVAGDKTTEPKAFKKFVAKPVSFAKYSVPKVIAANAAVKPNDKGTCATQSLFVATNMEASSDSDLVNTVSYSSGPSKISRQNHKRASVQAKTLPK